MGLPPLNYFVCTLGQAADLKETFAPDASKWPEDSDLLAVLRYQVRIRPNAPAVGFPYFSDQTEQVRPGEICGTKGDIVSPLVYSKWFEA
jgi:hypothetical protein